MTRRRQEPCVELQQRKYEIIVFLPRLSCSGSLSPKGGLPSTLGTTEIGCDLDYHDLKMEESGNKVSEASLDTC